MGVNIHYKDIKRATFHVSHLATVNGPVIDLHGVYMPGGLPAHVENCSCYWGGGGLHLHQLPVFCAFLQVSNLPYLHTPPPSTHLLTPYFNQGRDAIVQLKVVDKKTSSFPPVTHATISDPLSWHPLSYVRHDTTFYRNLRHTFGRTLPIRLAFFSYLIVYKSY